MEDLKVVPSNILPREEMKVTSQMLHHHFGVFLSK
jgi:hypothetical protein